ncbi:unnamed protein product [Oikopleura dioica]|uniref:RRM domain-containing protein n=1 Tax=Oikopleura dioica TaxID=34765 RepID=E4YAN0_OIKDI|nr:unnamed protein product [Oikopleura dioica]
MADYYNGAEQAQPEAGNEYAGQAQSYAEQAAPQQAEQEEQKEEGKLIQNSEISNDSKMFVGGLSRSTTTESLRTYFESFGALRDASVKIDTMTQQSRGFGFILFEDAASVDAVMSTPEHIQVSSGAEEHDDHAHFDMASQSKMRTLILVGALSLHAIFEGLVFGLSSGEVGDILGTMSAVLIHKSIIAFSTGMQLVSSEIEHVYLCSAICIFSMMAPLGVGIGILITSLGGETIGALIAVLESFAAGTFFYVTFLELVPHEFVGKHVKHGPLKCAIMFSGFMFMAIFQYLNPEEEE